MRGLHTSILFLAALATANGAVPDFLLSKVAEGVWAAIVSDEGLAGGNAGFVIGDDSVLVVDTFQDPRPAAALLAEVRKLTRLPIRFVVNTHYHLDHVSGNGVFAAAGAAIVAHPGVRAWMRTENFKLLDPPVTEEKKQFVASLTLPSTTYEKQIHLYLGARRIDVRYYPGHTGGDSVVWIPDAHVVFCGDLLWKDHVPNLVDASTEPWIETLGAMQTNYVQAIWIPGHGGVASAEDLLTFRAYLIEMRAGVSRELGSGKSGDALTQALLPSLKSRYGNWGFFADYGAANIEQTSQELSGKKKLLAVPKTNQQ